MKKESAVSAELDEALKRAKASTSKLGQLDNEVSHGLQAVERALQELKLGVPISTLVDDNFERGIEWVAVLKFEKLGGNWRLSYQSGVVGDDDWNVKPVTDCRRDLRAVLLREHVPKLVLRAAECLDEKIAERSEAIAVGSQVVAALQRAKDLK